MEKNCTYRRELLDYLHSALPLADRIVLSDEQLYRVIDHAIAVRAAVPWGKDIPETVFRAFVLFPRVNNEDPVFYHGPLWDILRPRIEGMGMYEAVVEINYFTCEAATYQPTDMRTANALTVITRAYGRCGEESVLLVSALRAAGIPARQVYVPRWVHCDSNHAWVEAWVDGTWRYLGACEPEPVLDSGWFTASASKAMLVHTRSYGIDPEGDRVENHIGNAAIINRTAGYADTCLFTVTVTEGGRPRAGLTVNFEVVNGSDFFAINTQITDEAGRVTLLSGKGTLRVHIHDGQRYLAVMADLARQDSLAVDFSEAVDFVRTTETYEQHPPVETRIQPTAFAPEVARRHRERFALCNELRARREATFRTDTPFYTHARGNHGVLTEFLADGRYSDEDKQALLETLREKDFVDLTMDVLTDALEGALPHKDRYPLEVWREGVLCPRVMMEMLYPLRAFFTAQVQVEADARAVWALLEREMELCTMDPDTLIPDLRAVWRERKASKLVMDVLYVALCRALGVAARLNPTNGEKEYYDGGWQALIPARKMDATLVLVNGSGSLLRYYANFSVARLEDGAFKALRLWGTPLEDRLEIPVMSGLYRVTTATRQADGSVDGYLIPVEVPAGGSAQVEVIMRGDRTREMLRSETLPPLTTAEAVLPEAGIPSVVALLEPGAEPTEHFLVELLAEADKINACGLRFELMVEDGAQAANDTLRRALAAIPTARLLTAPCTDQLVVWRQRLNAGDLRLPLAAAVDAEGKGLFAYANYHVGSVRSLMTMLEARK